MSRSRHVTRRNALVLGAAATALPLVHIRTAGAAGRLNVGFWDHWVPATNKVMTKQIQAWADRNKVEVNIDFITSNGFKIQVTQAAEAQAGTGHDILPFYNWEVQTYADRLEPADDVIKAMESQYGAYSPIAKYLASSKERWKAVPSSTGNLNLTCCGRISMLRNFAGIDIVAMYPAAKSDPQAAQGWNYDAFLQAAEACHKAGYPFGLGVGQTFDSVNNTGIIYSAFGAQLADARGEITVDTPAVHAVLDYARKLGRFLPPDAASYDDASNNRALISGKSALIMNPPSAWAVAKRDAPRIAEDCWHFQARPARRVVSFRTTTASTAPGRSAPTRQAAKELIHYLQDHPQVEERCIASEGYDLPPLASMSDFEIWSQVNPPKGTTYNYPIRPWHDSRENITGYPAPPDIAAQMYARAIHPTLMAKVIAGQSKRTRLPGPRANWRASFADRFP